MADRFREWTEDIHVAGDELNRTMRDLFEDVTVHRLVVRKPNGDDLFELPAAIGIVTGLFLWQCSLVAVGIARLANYRIYVVRRDTIPEDDLEVVIEEIFDDTDWPEEPSSDSPPKPAQDNEDKSDSDDDKNKDDDDFEIIFDFGNDDDDVSEPDDEIVVVDDAEAPADEPNTSTDTAASADLSLIKGIGPKYRKILNEAGITTYEALAEKTPDQLREIFESAGGRIPKVALWTEQARLAAAGKWDALERMKSKI